MSLSFLSALLCYTFDFILPSLELKLGPVWLVFVPQFAGFGLILVGVSTRSLGVSIADVDYVLATFGPSFNHSTSPFVRVLLWYLPPHFSARFIEVGAVSWAFGSRHDPGTRENTKRWLILRD